MSLQPIRQLNILKEKIEQILINQGILMKALEEIGNAYQNFAIEFAKLSEFLMPKKVIEVESKEEKKVVKK